MVTFIKASSIREVYWQAFNKTRKIETSQNQGTQQKQKETKKQIEKVASKYQPLPSNSSLFDQQSNTWRLDSVQQSTQINCDLPKTLLHSQILLSVLKKLKKRYIKDLFLHTWNTCKTFQVLVWQVFGPKWHRSGTFLINWLDEF